MRRNSGGAAHVEMRHIVCSPGCRLAEKHDALHRLCSELSHADIDRPTVDRVQICRESVDMMTTEDAHNNAESCEIGHCQRFLSMADKAGASCMSSNAATLTTRGVG